MEKNTLFVGLDVHAQTIAVATAERGREGLVQSRGVIPNTPELIRRMVKKLGPVETLAFCYEAGPCGYGIYRLLTEMGARCEVIAPTLVPTKSGERVKTDRLDAKKLARYFRTGDLTPIWVPDDTHEALRGLVRSREAAIQDRLRHRQQLGKFLLQRSIRRPKGINAWTQKYMDYLKSLKFEYPADVAAFIDYVHEVEHCDERIVRLEKAIDEAVKNAPEDLKAVVAALQALRGVAKTTAVTIATEVGKFSRFVHPRQLMGYSGLVPSEHSSGGPGKKRQGGITKTGNAHLRRILVESAWHYRHRPSRGQVLRKRQEGVSEEVKEIAWKAQHRLNGRYRRMTARGKLKQKVATAIARELLAFAWAIGVTVEMKFEQDRNTRAA